MQKIFKYSISDFDVLIPTYGKVVKVGLQNGVPHIWVLFNRTLDTGTSNRRFVIHGTGHDIPVHHSYVGTYFDGPFVWHVFEDESARKVV